MLAQRLLHGFHQFQAPEVLPGESVGGHRIHRRNQALAQEQGVLLVLLQEDQQGTQQVYPNLDLTALVASAMEMLFCYH